MNLHGKHKILSSEKSHMGHFYVVGSFLLWSKAREDRWDVPFHTAPHHCLTKTSGLDNSICPSSANKYCFLLITTSYTF